MRPATRGRVLLRGGRVLDVTGERVADVAVADGVIVAVGADLDRSGVDLAGARTLDCSGCVIVPGLVDLDCSVGEPGYEQMETIETAARAAALGGYTAIVTRPDTDPVIDNAAVVRHVAELAAKALVEVRCAATITVGGAGERLTPFAELATLGVRLFAEAGGVQDSRLLRRAMEYAAGLDIVIVQDAEDASLAAGGHMHEGAWSSRLGIAGIPAEAEEVAVMRDLALARLTGATLHFRRLSTAGSLAMVAAARRGGLSVTAEATLHHALLTDADCADFDPAKKFRPPLRTAADAAAVRAALADGAVDALVSDHTPTSLETKDVPFDEAEPGAASLEWTLALALGELGLPLADLLPLLSWRPAAIAGLSGSQGGPVEAGRPANLAVVDPAVTWMLDPRAGASRSRSTPFAGRALRGRVRHTICRGDAVVIDSEAVR